MSDEATVRPGSPPDLSRRMDRMEQKHDDLAREVTGLTSTVARVEINQAHAAELNKLRFDSLETGINGLTATVGAFMTRVEGLITGEVETTQSKQARELVTDYQRWRATVDDRLDGHDTFETQGRLLGRLAVILISTNVIGVVVAIGAAIAAFSK